MSIDGPASTAVSATAARVVERFGIAADAPAGGPPGTPCFLDPGTDRDGIVALLANGCRVLVERAEDGSVDGDWVGLPALERGFFLSLTTGTAFGIQGAVLVCNALALRGALPGERRSNVELCLHEAIVNAIVHGNLGIASSAKDDPQGYRVFSRLVGERLSDPAIRRRRLDLLVQWTDGAIIIGVGDQGNGFDASLLPATTPGTARSGRGFVMMRALASAVTIGDGGRCTTLRFDLQPD